MRTKADRHAHVIAQAIEQSTKVCGIQLYSSLPSDIQRLLGMSRNLSARTNFPATLLPLHTAPKTDLLVQNELPNHLHPAVVAGQIAVKLVRNLVQLPQPGPRHGREVMVLVVQADVVREQV